MTETTTGSRIAATFARLRAAGETGIIPYLTVGYPERDTILQVVPALVEAGAAMVELGIPFSDPLADGATIQRSSQVALANGVTVAFCLETARELRHKGVDVPLIAMGYFNPLLSYGLERFAAACAEAGIDGIIVPDLPPQESGELREALQRHGRDLIFMLAPTSTDAHMAEVARRASGFIYCVSLTGVTGARSSLSHRLPDFIARVRRHTDLPLAIGFGISRPEHVAAAGELAEGVVVGSALIERLGATPRERQPSELAAFIRLLRGV
ncbi:MAG: tryptophan synthase subunit alpha [Sphaerobacter sp.]|nr:tryptophan synthase subunit alpha [Sphaerobacter sp.]